MQLLFSLFFFIWVEESFSKVWWKEFLSLDLNLFIDESLYHSGFIGFSFPYISQNPGKKKKKRCLTSFSLVLFMQVLDLLVGNTITIVAIYDNVMQKIIHIMLMVIFLNPNAVALWIML